jgi:hypothetical protein
MGRQRRGKAAPSPVLASRYALRRAFDPNRGLRPPPSAAPPLSQPEVRQIRRLIERFVCFLEHRRV